MPDTPAASTEPPLHLATVTSPNYGELYHDWFLRTLEPERHNIRLHVRTLDFGDRTQFGFRSDTWAEACRVKVEHLLEVLRGLEPGEYLVFAEVDIQFFHPAELRDLVRFARARGHGFCAMKEGDHMDTYNGGFVIARNTPAVLAFLEAVARAVRHGPELALMDTTAINQLLRAHPGVHPGFVPPERVVYAAAVKPGTRPVFHHATCVSGPAQKAAQMREVRGLLRAHGIPVATSEPHNPLDF